MNDDLLPPAEPPAPALLEREDGVVGGVGEGVERGGGGGQHLARAAAGEQVHIETEVLVGGWGVARVEILWRVAGAGAGAGVAGVLQPALLLSLVVARQGAVGRIGRLWVAGVAAAAWVAVLAQMMVSAKTIIRITAPFI